MLANKMPVEHVSCLTTRHYRVINFWGHFLAGVCVANRFDIHIYCGIQGSVCVFVCVVCLVCVCVCVDRKSVV